MAGLSILNNIPSLQAQNELTITNKNLQTTLFRLSSGSRLNSGADDPAGLSIADQLHASIQALQQSVNNTNSGIGTLQVADGSFAQVTNLLDRAVTIATEASNGGLSTAQLSALDNEFTSIKAEIDRIGSSTTFNGTSVFTTTTTSIFLSDATSSSQIGVTIGTLSSAGLGLGSTNLLTSSNAQSALTAIDTAVGTIAQDRGTIGATLNRLQSAQNVLNTQVQNVTAAEDSIRAANIPAEVSNLSKFSVLSQTGIAALTQANQITQSVLGLFR
jgi:flagellin